MKKGHPTSLLLPLLLAAQCALAQQAQEAQQPQEQQQAQQQLAVPSEQAAAHPVAPASGQGQDIDFEEEIGDLANLQLGVILTLAACEDEPHCVTGVDEAEIAEIKERLEVVSTKLQQDEAPEQKSTTQTQTLLQEIRALSDSAVKLLDSVAQVEKSIDAETLEGDWSERFTFDEFAIGPTVPFPNEHVLLDRFEDAMLPLPIQ